ncbi:hypothetical protein NARC_100033 [Candidatus Nitrosocosmicus arcticus]|uniref:Uncharacterized protein n=1 Tax=Candidatus Nitrosocosmicus arcticus TaxID=2035267 RepID=A0A557STN7_9ARCH|nr:hypothetical protein NARC_100033 [Candidatus Nitrosocosmicus arcticus]
MEIPQRPIFELMLMLIGHMNMISIDGGDDAQMKYLKSGDFFLIK